MSKPRILILDGYSRNSLAILRSLGPKGYLCDIVVQPHPVRFYSSVEKALRSRYARKVHFIEKRSEEYIKDQLLTILQNNAYACLMAGGTFYSNLISKFKQELSRHTRVLSESHEKMQLVHDKNTCLKMAAQLGVPVPKTYIARNEEVLQQIAEETDGNVIVKLSDSFASKGLIKFTDGPQHLVEAYKREYGFNHKENLPLIQQLVEGELIDSTAFSLNGDPKAILTQKRELTAWLEGGGGIVNITNDIPAIKAHTATILNHLKWTGHIEMDWMYNEKTGECYLLEINPKFWGTTQLTISAGFDYPLWYVQHALGEPLKFPAEYRTGLRYRWLDDEMITVFTQPRSFSSFIRELTASCVRWLRPNTRTNFFISDLKPFFKGILDAKLIILKSWFGRKK